LNPAFLLTWSAVAAAAYSVGWLSPGSGHAPFLALGSFGGIVLWFFVVATLALRHRDRFRPESLARVVRGVGWLLIAFGLWVLGSAVLR
jgi:hypothetical protein